MIHGDVPSKKNSRILSFRGGRPMSFPGKHHQQWHRDACKQLLRARPVPKPGQITLTFFPKTRRASDLTNKAEAVMDCLVDNGVLVDDNWFVCPSLDLRFGAVDAKNPRVEINIIGAA